MLKNIAILTMSMDIGGAETHIYELSCALAKKGHNVTVFSAGGAYVEPLEKRGVKHITAPLNSKNPVALMGAYRTVRDYVKNNRDCIIHSHTRISNFTADMISKKYGVPFVSTIHGKFSTGFLQKLFTKWGTRALPVSEDLLYHTIEHYYYDRDKLRVTVNGIDLETFCKRDTPEFKKEMGFEPENKIILCVSRLNDTASEHVKKVINMAQGIYDSDPLTRILIVGGGDRYKELVKQAAAVNENTCDGFIRFTGPQTDIYRFCNIADLFIGISRSALEAMACKVPVILLGNMGYIGLLSESTIDACIDTNFTCRSFPYPEESEISALATDILANPDKYNDNVEYAFKLICDRYSVDRMAEDALLSYAEAEKDTRPYDMMLCGYYGRRNLGDDILLEQITNNMKQECDATNNVLLTSDPKALPENISVAIHRFNIPAIRKYMKQTKLFLLGGGSILQDATSSRSLFYYLFVSNLSKRYGCKLMLYSNGIGPINKKRHRIKSVELLEKADAITVRDERSLEYLRFIGVDSDNIQVTADEVFTVSSNYVTDNLLPEGEKYLCINLRSISITESFLKCIAEVINAVSSKYGFVPVLLPMHYKQDIPALSKLKAKLNCKYVIIDRQLSHKETLAILKQCEFAIVERLHAVIFSCIFGTPFVAINYDPKVKSLCRDIDMQQSIIDIKEFDVESMLKTICNAIDNSENISEHLKAKAAEKLELAKKNTSVAKTILNQEE